MQEEPPCRLPPLSIAEVREVVARSNAIDPPKEHLPPPNWEVHEFGCLYAYEESAFYINGQPSTPQHVDWSITLFVSRDGKVLR